MSDRLDRAIDLCRVHGAHGTLVDDEGRYWDVSRLARDIDDGKGLPSFMGWPVSYEMFLTIDTPFGVTMVKVTF